MKKVGVVILNWNGVALLKKFLPSVVESLPDYAEVIIADNASTDGSVEFVRSAYPTVRIIQNKENGGFAKGYNDALENLDHELFVLLNSDIETPNNWIEPIAELMFEDPTIGAAMPKILQQSKKTHFEYAGAAGGFIDKWGFPFCRGRIFNDLEEDLGQFDDDVDVFWATGACMFVRNEVFKKLGGFDEFFFAHMEEIDLCWRIQRLGYKIKAVGKSKVYHVGGGTLNKISPRKTYLNFRNNLLLLLKNHPPKHFKRILFQKMVMDGVASFKFLVEGNFRHSWAVLLGHFSFYKVFGKYWKLRKSLEEDLGHGKTAVVFNKSIVVVYFLKGVKFFQKLDKTAFK